VRLAADLRKAIGGSTTSCHVRRHQQRARQGYADDRFVHLPGGEANAIDVDDMFGRQLFLAFTACF
jgi:hypothetical protein